MVKTLQNGYGGGAKKEKKADRAMKGLKEYAIHLNPHGFQVNIDQIDEPLTYISLSKSKVIESGAPDVEPMVGFMDTNPERFKNGDKETEDRHKRPRSAMAADLERSLNDL